MNSYIILCEALTLGQECRAVQGSSLSLCVAMHSVVMGNTAPLVSDVDIKFELIMMFDKVAMCVNGLVIN